MLLPSHLSFQKPGLILVAIIQCIFGIITQLHDEEIRSYQIQQGQIHYNLIVKDSQLPKYGTCWKDALKNLENGCKQLTDEIQSRLALQFANCFLQKSGFETYPCKSSLDIQNCIQHINSNGFTAYTNFFTHTQSMCYFLQSQVWNEETRMTMNRLSENSVRVQLQLENASEKQELILQSQLTSLAAQQELLDKSLNLRKALDMSKDTVRLMLEEFKTSTDEHKHILFETFDRVAKLQNLVLGEMSGIYSFMFYPTALLVSYLLTSTNRTAAARFWIFIVFSCSFAIERFVAHWSLNIIAGTPADEASTFLYGRTWSIRKASMIICVGVLSYFAVTFRDLNLINNALLEDIRKQNLELRNFLQSAGYGVLKGRNVIAYPRDVTDSVTAADITGYSSDSDTSFDSQATDKTYIPKADWQTSDSEIEDSFRAASSLNTSPNQLQISGYSTKLSQKSDSNARTRPLHNRYNLRSRKNVQARDDMIKNESPETFSKTVKQMAKISRQNADKILGAINQRKNQNYFSSDEE